MQTVNKRQENMSNKKNTGLLRTAVICALLPVMLASCAKDEYYRDGGLADPDFDGSMMEYLDSKPGEFDTIAQIVRLAGLEEMFQSEDITFFAPSDLEVKRLIGYVTLRENDFNLNNELYRLNKDTVQVLSDVDSLIWKKYLQRHIFRGNNFLRDYPQVDYFLKQIYPGENYYSLNNAVLNIGVIYHEANNVKYAGYRQLAISYIPDVSNPTEDWITVEVSSSDIKPLNGVVHALSKGRMLPVQDEDVSAYLEVPIFGFDQFEFVSDVAASK